MKRKITKWISLLIVIFITPVIFLLGLSAYHHQSAHDEVVDYINREFDGKITFEDFSFSYLSRFPRVHINLQGISINGDTNEIARIENLDLLLNLKSFWRKELSVEELLINDAELHSITDSLGHKPQIISRKKKSADSNHGNLLINVKKILFLNSRIHFANEIKGNSSYFYIKDSQFDIISQDSLLLIKGSLVGQIDTLIANKTVLFINQPIKGREVVFTINRNNGEKTLKEGYVMAHTLRLEPRLKMKPHEDGQLIELYISGDDKFNDVLNLFEFHSGISIKQLNPDARLKISYHLQGFVNPFLRPYNELDFEINKAEFSGGNLPFPIKVGRIKGNYNNGEGHSPATAELQIDTLHAKISDSYINGRFKLTNLKDPVIDAHFVSQIDMSHLFEQNEKISISGTIYADLVLDGKISELRQLHLDGKQHAKGSIKVDKLELAIKDKGFNIEIEKATSSLNNHIFEVSSLSGAFNGSAFHFHGNFDNLDRYVLEDMENLAGNFVLNFDTLDLQKLNFNSKEETPNSKSVNMFPLEDMTLDLAINGKEIITDIGNIKNIVIQASIKGPEVTIQEFNADFLDGKSNITGRLHFGPEGLSGLWADANIIFNRIDIDHIISKYEKKDTDSSSKMGFRFPQEMDLKINISSGKIIYRDATISNFRSKVHLTEQQINIDDLYSDLFSGNIKMDLLISDYQNDRISYNGDVNLTFDSLDADKILMMKALGIPAHKFKKQDNASKKNPLLILSDNLSIKLKTSAKYISYNNANIEDLSLLLDYNEETIELKTLDYLFAGGIIKIHGHILKKQPGPNQGYLYSKADSIDIQKIFASFDNFAQDVFTADNSTGKISWASHYYFNLDKDFKLEKDDDLWLVNALVHQAEFDEVEPIEKTLFFIGHKSKDKMIVNELDMNGIMFRNKIYFMDVLMNDNIANLDVFGEVDLAKKEMDLGLEISLSDLFFRSKKERIVETQEGIVNLEKDAKLFLRMQGSLTEHKLKKVSKRKFNKNRNTLTDDIKEAEEEFKNRHIKQGN